MVWLDGRPVKSCTVLAAMADGRAVRTVEDLERDGRLLCTYGYRPGRHGDPGGIRATVSRDGGRSWDIDQEVRLRSDFLNMDIGYPESLQLPDGSVLTVYYFNLFGRFFIGGTFWTP